MKKGYIKMNLLGDKYYIRKDVVLEMIRKHPDEVVNYVDKETLTAIVIDSLIDEYIMSGYDDEEDEYNLNDYPNWDAGLEPEEVKKIDTNIL